GMRHRNATYAAMVHSLDENVGRVLDKLKERGLERDTIVIFTSDNGGYIGRFNGEVVTNNAPLRSGKGSAYQGGVRIPLIVRAPGVTKAGTVCAEPVTTMDFFPTIAALTGAVDHGKHDGVNLVPLLREAGAKLGRERLYFHYPHYYETTSPVSAVREGEWKLLEYFEDGHVELYNLERDPGETREVSAENAAVAGRLRRALEEWRREVGARMPVVNAGYAGK
ncbi:MAG: sulfatase-like hydrolase/transferase, partial [Acidobacteria bacterium]|nr:sulfatase-like hydrolase/transferase [Acidobacteriota bacterium]